jgi:hypothetical protein
VIAIYIADPGRAPVVHKNGLLVLFTLCIAICEPASFLDFYEFRSNFWPHFVVVV